MSDQKVTKHLRELTVEIKAAGKAQCCGILEALSKMYDLPFERPIGIHMETLDMKVLEWSVCMMKRTPSGNVSQSTGPHMIMSFCPFCGAQLKINQ